MLGNTSCGGDPLKKPFIQDNVSRVSSPYYSNGVRNATKSPSSSKNKSLEEVEYTRRHATSMKGSINCQLTLRIRLLKTLARCKRTFSVLTVLLVICTSQLGTVLGKEKSGSTVISDVHKHVPTGSVVHLFPRYGYLSLSMRVVPRNDSQGWVFLEPVKNVLVGSTIRIEEKSFSSSDNSLPLHNEFHIDLCEDIGQLVQAYFRRFKVQGLSKPWLAFAGGWRTPSLSKYFGLDPVLVVGDYRYMLVRVLMVRNSGSIELLPNVTYSTEYRDDIRRFQPEDDRSIYRFSTDVGTHYIHSYVAGNSLYQVFVYDAAGFDAVKKRLSEFDAQKSSSSFISELPQLLPLWVKQIGKLFVLNSSPEISDKIHESLTTETIRHVSVPNIFKLHDNPSLVRNVEMLLKDEPSGLLGIELRTLDVLFSTRKLKDKFNQALKHLMQLWELNFR